MQLDNQAKYKGSALKTIMNSPKLSKILQDGLESPIGSTKRTQAKSILSIMKKIGGGNTSEFIPKAKEVKDNYTMLRDYIKDGQGGPETSPSTTPTLTQRAPTPINPNFSSTLGTESRLLAPKNTTPTTNLTIGPTGLAQSSLGVKKPTVNIPGLSPNLSMTSSLDYKVPTTPSLTMTPEGTVQGANDFENLIKGIQGTPKPVAAAPTTPTAPKTTPSTTGATSPDVTYKEKGFADYGDDKGIVVSTGPDTWFFVSNNGMSRGKVGAKQEEAIGGVATDNPEFIDNTGKNAGVKNYSTGTIYATSANTWMWMGNNGEIKKGENGKPGEVIRPATAGVTGTTGSTAGTTGETGATADNLFAGTNYESTWNNMPDAQKKALLPMVEMVAANYGPDMAAMMIQSDHEKMKALFPGVPDDQLPWGASYLRQVDDLSSRLKEEYKLNLLTNEKANLAKSGSTLVQDLTKYIKGRDTYIESVNGMIDKVKSNMIQSSGIAGNAMNKQYLDYLYVLKGRQNSRYTTLINDATTRHDAMMENLDNEIKTRTAQYKEELATKTEMTKTDYDNMRKTLASMYTSIASAPLNDLAIKQAQVNYDKSNLETIKDALGSSTSGKTPLEEVEAYKKNFITTDSGTGITTLIPDTDLNYKIPLALSGTGYDPVNLTSFLTDAIKSTYGNSSSFADLQKGINMIDNYNESSSTDASGNVLVPKTTLYQALSTPIYNTVKNVLKDKMSFIKNALKELAKKGSDKLPRDKFVSDYNGDIGDEDLLKAIWDSYVESIGQPGATAQDIFGDLNNISDDDLIKKIVNNIQYSLIPA